jgi:transposase
VATKRPIVQWMETDKGLWPELEGLVETRETMTPMPFSTLPTDTARATKSIFHIENLYLAIGDQLPSLCADIDWTQLDAFGEKPASRLFLVAMVTAFQYAEELSDRAAANAVRERTDWKYALHLPLDFPGLDPAELAEFRSRLRSNADGRQVFRRVLARLARTGLLRSGAKGEISASDVLARIEYLNRVEGVSRAMCLALENLAATDPEWLQANSLPHWVERYGPQGEMRRRPILPEEQQNLLDAFETDITHLLGAIARSGRADLARMPEIQTLQALSEKFAPGDAVS